MPRDIPKTNPIGAAPRRRRSLCLIASDRDFLFRHFAPIIAAALASDLDTRAILPETQTGDISRIGAVRVTGSPSARERSILTFFRQIRFLVTQFNADPPDMVMVFSVRTALALALALPFVRIGRVFVYVTGLGLLQLLKDPRSRVVRGLTYYTLRTMSRRHPDCYFIFENGRDRSKLGFGHGEPRSIHVMGAGVDVAKFVPQPWPVPAPLRLASVSRLVWSKGLDLAIQAVSELAGEGLNVTLDIYGAPDPSNPLALDAGTFAGVAGVTFKGHTSDIVGVWADHHVAIFPTRGGEGTPRSLLEAAACGRAAIVTDIDGCSEFIRDKIDGLVVETESVAALKSGIRWLYDRPDKIVAFGQSARTRVCETCSSDAIQATFIPYFK